MSSLLQNVLASRLAQATLGGSEDGGDSGSKTMQPPASTSRLHASSNDTTQHSTQALDEWERVDNVDVTSDDELVGVVSLPGTVPGTPHISRPPSPGSMSRQNAPSKRSALSKNGFLSVAGTANSRKSKTDPLRSLPKEVHKDSLQDDYANVAESAFDGNGAGGARWTRRASKMDWKTQYAKQRRMEAREQQRLESLPGSGATTPSRTQRMRDEGLKTTSEARQDEWREQEAQGYTKDEMRDWYKSQGGSKGGKLKGKRAKGGAKTGANDGSLWE